MFDETWRQCYTKISFLMKNGEKKLKKGHDFYCKLETRVLKHKIKRLLYKKLIKYIWKLEDNGDKNFK